MKKVILALAIVSVSFAACNNAGESKETPKDSTPVVETPKVDSPAAPVVADTTAKPAVADTTKK